MVVDTFRPSSVYNIQKFINNSNNDIVKFCICRNGIYLGSIMPRMYETQMKYDNVSNTLDITLYINRKGYLCKEIVLLYEKELKEYAFYYL